jgi:hypothetical protein
MFGILWNRTSSTEKCVTGPWFGSVQRRYLFNKINLLLFNALSDQSDAIFWTNETVVRAHALVRAHRFPSHKRDSHCPLQWYIDKQIEAIECSAGCIRGCAQASAFFSFCCAVTTGGRGVHAQTLVLVVASPYCVYFFPNCSSS